eukprot:PITA_34565
MGDEFVNEPCDPAELRFSQLKEQVADINRNVNLLMAALSNKLGIFGEEGGSNAEDKSEGGSEDREDVDDQSKKEPGKDQPSSSFVNQSLFKVEAKVDIKPYHGEIDALKLNHWSHQLEVYFIVHQIGGREKDLIHAAEIGGPCTDLVGEPHGNPKEYTTKFRKMAIILGISPKNPDVLLKYLGDLHRHLCDQVILFKPKTMGKAYVQAQYLENIGLKRVQSSGSKQKEQQETSKEWKKKQKGGKDKKTTATTQQCKDPSNHCNIDGHTEEKCWKLHPELNSKNKKKDNKKKNLMAIDSSNQVERSPDVDEKIVCTSVKKEVNLSSLQQQEEKEMTKLFHVKIQVKKTKIDALFDSRSQGNLIATDLVKKLGLEVRDHPNPYPLGWVHKDAELKVTK